MKLAAYIAVLTFAAFMPVLTASDAKTDVVKRPVGESYRDDATGIEFPPKCGAFKKISVRRNLNPVYGTTIRYAGPNGEYADVYIYSLDTSAKAVAPAEFTRHVKEVSDAILSMTQRNKIIKKVSLMKKGENDLKDVEDSVYSYRYEINVDGELMMSHLAMLLHKGRVIKIRITYPELDDSGKPDSSGEDLCGDFASRIKDMAK